MGRLISNLSVQRMRSFFATLALVAAASCTPLVPKLDSLEYGFCDGSPTPATITASVEPFPVVIATGETITISVSIDLAEEVPVGTQVSLQIKKEGIIDIPFPCIEIEGLHIGSCDYDGDTLIGEGADVICTDYFPDGQACGLPLAPGMYGGDPSLVLTVPEIPAIIGDLLGSGTYYAQASLITPDGATFACIFVRVSWLIKKLLFIVLKYE